FRNGTSVGILGGALRVSKCQTTDPMAFPRLGRYFITSRLDRTVIALPYRGASAGQYSFIYIPMWPFLCCLSLALSLVYWRRKKTRLQIRGSCSKCGYNLDGLLKPGTADQVLCPECGAVQGEKSSVIRGY